MEVDTTIPNRRFMGEIHAGQRAVLDAYDRGHARFAHLIWHRRGRKTTLAINLGIRECIRRSRFTCRHILPKRTQAEEVVWNDPNMLFAYLPPQAMNLWRPNISSLTIRFANGSRYVLDGADKLADDRRGISGDLFICDEWAFHENAYVYEALIRPILAEDERKGCWFLTTFNGVNHASEMYERAKRDRSPDTYVHLMKASESGVLSAVELAKARAEMPDALYAQEFECEPMSATDMVLIQPSMLKRLEGIHRAHLETRRIVSIDTAFGGDQCVIMGIENTRIVEKKSFHPERTSEIVGEALLMGSRIGTRNYIGDVIGNGTGVMHDLSDVGGTFVQPFDSRSKPADSSPRMFNRRAEAWYYTSQRIRAGEVEPVEDAELARQLTSVRYKVVGLGAIQIEEKAAVRARLGRSPDDADAYVMGQWGLRHVQPMRDGEDHVQMRMFRPAAASMGGMVA